MFDYLKHAERPLVLWSKSTTRTLMPLSTVAAMAAGMSKGVQFLMKKNKIDVVNGFGKVLPNKQVSVTLDGKEEIYQANHIICDWCTL